MMMRLLKQTLQYKLLVILIVAASCLRVFVCFQHNPMNYLWSDMLRHWNNGGHFPKGGYAGASDPIVYQVYVWLLRRLTWDNKLLIATASALLSVLMPWTYYRAARDFGLTKIPSLWVWTLIAWTPSLLVLYHYLLMETLLLLLEGLALWMTARYLRKGGTEAFLTLMFSWTLAALTKPTVIPLAGICFLWCWWKKSTPLRDIALGVLLAAIMLVPQAVRSKVSLGFVAPFGNPWLTRIQLRSGAKTIHLRYYTHAAEFLGFHFVANDYQLDFSSPSCYVRPLSPLSDWTMQRSVTNSEVTLAIDSAHGEQDWKAAYAAVRSDPETWLAQWRENIILFFFAPSWPESTAGDWDGRLEYCSRWIWAPLILFILVANIRQFMSRRFEFIPVAVTIFTLILAFQNVVITEGRYRKPVEPLLLLNLVWLLDSKRLDRGENFNATPD